ncbi:MAG TPA: hypothetical protein VLA21_03140, partial [Candidatus Limnocylindria bacterium]|nr:hypothetical protein [Candidatus Limnocylindria bacterium]
MGKRVCAAALAMLLLCAGAGAEGFTFEQALSLYSGVIGTVHFALPGAPQVVHDEDYPGRWTGSTQLFGNAPGGEEYQFRTGDIGEWVEGYKASGPSLTPLQARANALIGFAAFFILHYGGEPDNIRADGDKAVLTVTFEYSYPDTPGVLYRCKAVLEGTTAVCLMGEDCAELLEAMGRLRPLTPQEMAALAPSPETVTLGALTADFPGKVFSFQSEGSRYAACFTRDFTWCAVQQLDASVALTQGEDELKASLAALAGRVMLPPVAAQGGD